MKYKAANSPQTRRPNASTLRTNSDVIHGGSKTISCTLSPIANSPNAAITATVNAREAATLGSQPLSQPKNLFSIIVPTENKSRRTKTSQGARHLFQSLLDVAQSLFALGDQLNLPLVIVR